VATIVAVVGITVVSPPVSAAPIFSDGFESGTTLAWTFASNVVVQDARVRTGSWAAAARAVNTKAFAWRDLGSTYGELHATSRFLVVSNSTGVWFHSLRRSNGAAIALVGMNAGRKLIMRNAVSGTTYVSSTIVTTGTWHEVEIRVLVGASGRADVWYDGSPVATLSRSGNFGPNPMTRLMIGDNATRTFDLAIDDVSVAAESLPADGVPPTTPGALVATPQGSSRVDLTWDASFDESGVAGYTVYRSTDGVTYAQAGTVTTTTFSDRGLAPETQYRYTVDAFDPTGNRSPRSDVASATTGPAASVGQMGSWSAPFELGVVGVHTMVLHTGDVLLWRGKTASIGTVAKLLDPETRAVTDVAYLGMHNLLCTGMSFLPGGEVLVTGGVHWQIGGENGTTQTAVFDPATRAWRVGPTMAQPRWYPTNVTLSDGRALLFAGKTTTNVIADAVERYDPTTDSLTTLSPTASLTMTPYPRMFLRADGRVMRVGEEQKTIFFDPATETWSDGPLMKVGTRKRGSVVLLPGLDRVLAIGGVNGGVTTATTEILDLSAASPAWQYSASMASPRRNLNAVLLPDGTVLAVGGNRQGEYDLPVLAAELFDPSNESWRTMASLTASRAYHSTAVLLPDGRVLAAGQTFGAQQTTAEIFSPPYLFRGPRPAIDDSPSNVSYGQTFSVSTSDAESTVRVALIRPDAVTHGVNFDQRYLILPFTASSGGLTVRAPDASVAPPGWYMLFLVNSEGVPSVASWVHLT
jgi:hypothetical protein